MSDLIKTGQELINQFTHNLSGSANEMQKKEARFGYFVRSKVKADILCSESQGKIIIGGNVKRIYFTSIGAGVWKANVTSL